MGVRAPAVAMRSEKTDKIVESLKELTLLEASELVKAIEETFGVDASASAGAVLMSAPAGGGGGEDDGPAEKTEFDVVLTDVPKAKKIAILKAVRGLLGVGLKEAKAMVDNPGTIMEGKPKDICEDAKKQLEEAVPQWNSSEVLHGGLEFLECTDLVRKLEGSTDAKLQRQQPQMPLTTW